MIAVLLIAFAFLIGSIPFGLLLAKRLGIDIRNEGSGNIGATNVTRILGAKWGAVTLILDAAKGAGPVLLASRTGNEWLVAATGFAAIAGHCFSPWLGGRGGKGVATAFGVFLVVSPALTAIAVIVFVVMLVLTKVPAIGSLAGVFAIALVHVYRSERPLAALACATLGLLLYTHRVNLAKLRG